MSLIRAELLLPRNALFGKKTRVFLAAILVFLGASGTVRAADYYSIASTAWNLNTTWSTTGFGGGPAAGFPVAGDVVHIGPGRSVTVLVDAFCTTLNVNAGGTLVLQAGGITVSGVTTVNGTVSTAVAAGNLKRFAGLVDINAGATWNLSTTNPTTSFGAGISMDGALFNNGTSATAFTASQVLSGASNMSFGGVITPAGGTTLTNNNTATVSVSSITLTGNVTQGPGSTLQMTGGTPFTGAGTLNATANQNIVRYAGAAQTARPVNYRTLELSGSGAKTLTGVAAIQTDFSISGTATATTAFATVGGNLSVGGTATLTQGAALVITGTVTVGAGSVLLMTNFAFTVTNTTTINGTIGNSVAAAGTKTFTGAVLVNAGGVWNLSGNNPVTSFGGGIQHDGTTFNNGSNTANFSASQSLSGASNMTFGTVVPAAGQTLTNNNTGTVQVNTAITLTGNFTQGTGSTLALAGTAPFTGAGTFNANTNANTVNYNGTGGAQTVRLTTYRNLTMSGSAAKTMGAGISTINDFTMAGTATATATAGLTFGGNVTLGAGSTFVPGAFTQSVGGNWVNNGGTFTNAGSTINFNGATQSIGGSSSTTFNNLTISGTSTTFTIAVFTAGRLTLDEGSVVNLNALTTHTANRLHLGGNGQIGGTWGGTGSGAASISAVYFTAGTGRVTVAVTSTQSLPFIEDFSTQANGDTYSATPAWNVTQLPSSGTFEKEQPLVQLGDDGFEINNTGAQEGIWQTADLDIGAGVTEIAVSLDITAFGTNAATDYVKVSYVWDGGLLATETLIATVTEDITSPVVFIPATGHTKFRLVIRGKDNTGGSFIAPFEFAFDNINIIPIRTLYSRASTAWNVSGTWSVVAVNGATCACTPSAAGYDRIVVGGGQTVTLAGASAASRINVNGTADVGGAGTLSLSTFGLTVGLGGSVTVNTGGIINSAAGSSLNFSDNQSHTITANGSVTVGALTYNNAAMWTGTTGTINGSGTFAVTGNLTESTAFLGTLTVTTNTPTTIGGIVTLNFQTSFTNNSTVTMTSTAANTITDAGTWNQALNSTLNFAGASFDVNNFEANSAVNLVNYNRAGAQAITGTDYWHLTLSNSGAKTLDDDITLRGNWIRSGTATFAHGNNEVEFNALAGTAAQSITSVGTETFDDLTISSAFATSPQITFNNAVTVVGTLDMNSGNINLNSNTLTLSLAAGALAHNTTSGNGWAYGGTFVRAFQAGAVTLGNVEGLIPIGTATNYRPFFFAKNNNGPSAGSLTLTHTDASTSTGGLNIADTNPVANIITRHNASWSATMTGGTGSTFQVRFGGTGLGTVTSLAHVRAMLLNSVIGTNQTATTLSVTEPRVDRIALTVAQMTNTWYLGSTSAASPLPIQLVSFKGIAHNYGVELQWKTNSEIDNDFFTISHSDGIAEFKPIGTVTGNGTSHETHDYSLIDYKPLIGKNYYKLHQTDFDGRTAYHGVVMVDVTSLGGMQVFVYPNPLAKNRQLNVEFRGLDPAAPTDFQIVDMRGITIRRGSFVADQTGAMKTAIDFTDGIPGVYLLKYPGGQFKFAIE